MAFADTSVWIDYLAGRRSPQVDLFHDLLRAGDVQLGDLVAGEVLRGIRDDLRAARVRRELLTLDLHAMADTQTILRSAQNYRTLRKLGVTVRSPIDCLIATFCIDNGHVLLHNDRDFDAFEQHLGLQVVRAVGRWP